MARVELASLSLGWITDSTGNAQSGVAATITDQAGVAATVYTASTGSTTTTATSDSNGYLRGFLEEGTYTVTVSGTSHTVEVVSGVTLGAVNVKSVGAKGDGVTDDTNAIQEALTAAVGGECVIPAGTYKVSSALSVGANTVVRGAGNATVLRASGNHYVFKFNTGQHSRVYNLRVEATSSQSSGGGFDYSTAASNVWLDHIWFGDNLYIGVDIRPTGGTRSIFHVNRARWDSVAGSTYGVLIGDGTNLVTDVHINDVVASAATTGGIATGWLEMRGNTDSVFITDCGFYQGAKGITMGGVAGVCTGAKLTNVYVDTMLNEGLDFQSARDAILANVNVQTCGTSNSGGAAVFVESTAKGIRWTGGTVQNNYAYGVLTQSGATHIDLSDLTVSHNNTSNTAFRDGIAFNAGATKFRVTGCRVGNDILVAATGHQKYGISVGVGASDYYFITNNDCAGNATGGVSDGGAGVNKTVSGNLT